MDYTASHKGATYKERDSAVAPGVATTIIDGVVPPFNAAGLQILFSMDNVAAWANGRLEIFNKGVSVWVFEDQFLTLLEPFFLFRNVKFSDNYSAVLTHNHGVNVEAAIQISIEPSVQGVHE